MMRRYVMVFLVFAGCMMFAGTTAFGEVLPGKNDEERALNGVKEYIKKHNLKDPQISILLTSNQAKSFPKYAEKFTGLTGVKVKSIPYGTTEIPTKIMAEAVAKTGQWDIFNVGPYALPDAVGAGVLEPLDEYAAKGKPDFSGRSKVIEAMNYYNGKLYTFLHDNDTHMLFLRKDIMELAKEDYKKKFGKEPGCPETMDEMDQMAAYFHTKKGETRWGVTFDQDLSGFIGYRAMGYLYRSFPAYFAGLWFDKDMKPRINTPRGIAAIKQYTDEAKYMPRDVLGWLTPQLYPYWASGQAFSFMSFVSAGGYGETNPKSVIKGKQEYCPMPGVIVNGKLRRRPPQAAGIGWMVNHYSKHPELAYYMVQWMCSTTIGDDMICDPDGYMDVIRKSNLTNEACLKKYGKKMMEVALESAEYCVNELHLEGNAEYWNVLEKNLSLVMQGNITPEEAAKRIEEGWNKVTEDIGRKHQIEIWRATVESGIYVDTFKEP